MSCVVRTPSCCVRAGLNWSRTGGGGRSALSICPSLYLWLCCFVSAVCALALPLFFGTKGKVLCADGAQLSHVRIHMSYVVGHVYYAVKQNFAPISALCAVAIRVGMAVCLDGRVSCCIALQISGISVCSRADGMRGKGSFMPCQ